MMDRLRLKRISVRPEPVEGRFTSWFDKLTMSGVIICLVFAMSCATSFDSRGRYHKVMSGETLDVISKSYRVDLQEVAELNNIEDVRQIEVGQKVYLPEKEHKGGYKKLPFGNYLKEDANGKKNGFVKYHKKEKKSVEQEKIVVDRGRFIWPLNGKISSQFGIRNGRRHDGLDICAKNGTPIKAAGNGKVVFSGKMRGYGNLVILRHEDDFFTVYAHNSRNLVAKGKTVSKGQQIAKVGSTGRSSGPHLHFEVRNGQKARNPLFFLPKRG
ncbi:MAG: LysM peptidoglycan-binding domain-containing M23 family metallopeptidase [Pseudomonadota bacterium]